MEFISRLFVAFFRTDLKTVILASPPTFRIKVIFVNNFGHTRKKKSIFLLISKNLSIWTRCLRQQGNKNNLHVTKFSVP